MTVLTKENIMKFKLNRATRSAAILTFLTAVSVTACGEDNNSPPDDDDIINPEGGATASGGRSPSASGGSKNGSGGRSEGGSDGDTDNETDGDTEGDTEGDTDGDTDGNDGSGGGLVVEPEREDCSDEPNEESDELGECWDLSECNGKATVQFLNQCAGEGTCIGAFDNESRIEGFDGTLPSLN